MIQAESWFKVADSMGVREVMCIKVLSGLKRRYASAGDIVKTSAKSAVPRGCARKGDIYNAVVVRTAKSVRHPDGSLIKFNGSAVVLLSTKLEPIGIRILGPATHKPRIEHLMKVVSLAPEVL